MKGEGKGGKSCVQLELQNRAVMRQLEAVCNTPTRHSSQHSCLLRAHRQDKGTSESTNGLNATAGAACQLMHSGTTMRSERGYHTFPLHVHHQAGGGGGRC